MRYIHRFKITIVFVMAFFLSVDSGFVVLAQARAAEAAQAQGFLSSVGDKIDSGVQKCKAVAADVANYSKEILGPLADASWGCVKDIFKGAWSSSGGAVVDGFKAVGSGLGTAAGCVSNPAFCKGEIANSGVVRGAASVASTASSCAGSPIQCARNVAAKVKNTATFVTGLIDKVKSQFSDLSSEQIRDVVCNLLGNLGGSLLLAIATGGAAAGVLAANLAKVMLFLQKLATVGPIGTMMKLMNIPIEVLMKMSAPVSDRLIALLKKDISLSPKLKAAVMSCSIR